MTTTDQAKKEILDTWERYDNAPEEQKIKLFFEVTDLIIKHQKQNLISRDYGAYRICHCCLGRKILFPEDIESAMDEACDIEMGTDFIEEKEFYARWEKLTKLLEELKTKYLK